MLHVGSLNLCLKPSDSIQKASADSLCKGWTLQSVPLHFEIFTSVELTNRTAECPPHLVVNGWHPRAED